ncbi:MAG: DNA replication/repair protein RecF [Alphaproteobacteria bacterium]
MTALGGARRPVGHAQPAIAQAEIAARPGLASGADLSGGAPAAVTRLALTDFRCYARLKLVLDARPVVLTGPNGAGKTNLLEALSYFAPGRGLRRARLGEVDRIGAGPWGAAATVLGPMGALEIGTGHDRPDHGRTGHDRSGAVGDGQGVDGRRAVRVDGRTERGQAVLASAVAVFWLTPDMDRLFAEGPGARRRFLDRLVYGFDPEHARRVAVYEHAMRERARILREGGGDGAWLSALEDRMAREGVAIASARRAVAERLARVIHDGAGVFPKAGLGVEGPLERSLAEGPALAAEDIVRAALAAARGEDAISGGAATGPHKSDLVVRHLEKDMPAALCSTGEHKALLISIALANARLVALDRGAPPILLLDEVAAHLDATRRVALFETLLELRAQAWMTGTDAHLFAPLGQAAQHFTVAEAAVVPLAGVPS